MNLIRPCLLICIILILLSLNTSNVQGRYHYHKKQKTIKADKISPVSQSPADSPSLQDPVPEPPTYPPPIPSDPVEPIEPSDPPEDQSSGCTFDVTSYGAVGDGTTDDTAAFRNAWKEACGTESALLLIPSGYTFMITSTIFSGPCKPGLVLQLDGVLMPPNGPDCWPKKDSRKQWLVFYQLNYFTFTGIGTIEGNGQQWWELPCKPHRGPNGSTLPGPCDSPAEISIGGETSPGVPRGRARGHFLVLSRVVS